MHGVIAGVAVQLLDDLARLLVAAPKVARPHARLQQAVIQRREVDVERLRRRPAGPRLHELSVGREAARWDHAIEVGGVDHRLAVYPRQPVERLADRSSRDRQQHDVGGRPGAAAAPEARHLMAGALPQVGETTADVAPATHRDPHRQLSPSPFDLTAAPLATRASFGKERLRRQPSYGWWWHASETCLPRRR